MTDKVVAIKTLALALLKEAESLEERSNPNTSEDAAFYDKVREFEINLIRSALIRTGGNQRRAARLLGLNATTLNSKIKTYDINPSHLVATDDDGQSEARGERPTPGDVQEMMCKLEEEMSCPA